ncbi:hypothetical protein SO802_000084 [Lithocarpus litseifolius]|uniref:Uncharacterized protein n=1 Tax=Lithocarpus litseifolius TaxID=425828 RepID=A0AAW2DUS9_9ROSI
MEDSIQRCYVETVHLESDDFVKLIRLDAGFILELFLRYYEEKWEVDHPMFVEAWLLEVVWHELLLLENQLPFFVIEKLYQLAFPNNSNSPPSLNDLTFNFFKSLNTQKKNTNVKIQHFTDLLRFFHLPSSNKLPYRETKLTFPKYSATQLREAGVTFKVASRKCALNLDFQNGMLDIPLLKFQDTMEALIRNIMALEQCDHRRPAYTTDFYLMLDHLINTSKDVDLLSSEGIIDNRLGDSNAVTSMINNLNKGIFRRDMNSDYYDLCRELNVFYEKPWHRWKATLKHEYFSTPWGTASTIAAIFLLVLTLIQTICSIIQVV